MNPDLDGLFQFPSDDFFFSQLHENSIYGKNDDLLSINSICPSLSTEHFQGFFSSDNPTDISLTHLYSDNANIDNFIVNMQIKLKPLYFDYDFSGIINILDSQFPCFFGESNYSLLYTIQKLRFFRLLQTGSEIEINLFYFDTLLRLLKEVKPTEWKNKHKFFIKLIKKKNIFKKRNILEKYYEQFQFELDKAIRNYLSEGEHSSHDMYITTSKKQLPTAKKENLFNVISINNDINNIIPNNKNDLEIEDLSTKVEFSDFEDEIDIKFCDDNNGDNNISQPNQISREISNIVPINSLNIPSSTESSINRDNNIRVINTSSYIDKDTEKTTCTGNSKKVLNTKTEQTLFNQLPFLSSFKPKYAKRETIDKKIIRHFRQFVINQNKQKKFIITNTMKDYSFYILLINGGLLPPIDFYDNSSNEKIAFKSFNSNYLLWFFSKKGIKDLYLKFTSTVGLALLEEVSTYYGLNDKEKTQLENYINNLPFIFDISLVNKITDNEGYNCGHLYRKNRDKEKVAHSRKDFISKFCRMRKERSRDIDDNNIANNISCDSEE